MSDFQFSPVSTKIVNIEGMTCGHCKMKVEKALKEIKEVLEVEVDLIDASAEIKFSDEIDESIINSKISNAGFKVV